MQAKVANQNQARRDEVRRVEQSRGTLFFVIVILLTMSDDLEERECKHSAQFR